MAAMAVCILRSSVPPKPVTIDYQAGGSPGGHAIYLVELAINIVRAKEHNSGSRPFSINTPVGQRYLHEIHTRKEAGEASYMSPCAIP
jgi:hypothetical protein